MSDDQWYEDNPTPLKSAIEFTVVLIVASIPMAMEIVCNTTLAVGAGNMLEFGAIVSRLNAIEDMAGAYARMRVCAFVPACGSVARVVYRPVCASCAFLHQRMQVCLPVPMTLPFPMYTFGLFHWRTRVLWFIQA